MSSKNYSKLQKFSTEVWNNLYSGYEKDKPLGIQYPTEALVIFVSTQRKDMSLQGYFDDASKEYSVRNSFFGNALEIGFGTIANLKMINEKGYRCFGLEVSEESVKRGTVLIKKNRLKGIQLTYWHPYKIPYPDNYFNLIYGLQCIYYNLEIEKTIEEIFRVMAPGGIFCFPFFSMSHTYMKFIDKVSDKIYKWSDKHPNIRLRGACFVQPSSKDELLKLFSKFVDLKVFTTESDQTPLFESWWYVTGRKG